MEMPEADPEELATAAANSLLGSTTKNRLQRLAKNIVESCVEFIFAAGALWAELVRSTENYNNQAALKVMLECGGFTCTEDAEEQCWQVPRRSGLYVRCNNASQCPKVEDTLTIHPLSPAFAFCVVAYVFIATFCVYRRARRIGSCCRTSAAVEAAYAKTGRFAFLDGIMEIPLTVQHLGWSFTTLLWGFNLILLIALALLWTYSAPTEEKSSMIFTSVLVAVEVYRITVHVSEFLVLTHPDNLVEKADDKVELDRHDDSLENDAAS